MKKKRHIVQTADDTAETIVAKLKTFVRAGLRDTLKAKGDEWAPVWVREVGGNTWSVKRGGEPSLTIWLSQVPAECRPLVARLVDLLDEQAWMARVAQHVATEPVERDAKIVVTSNAGGEATAAAANKKYADLDDRILGFIERGESTREYTKEWAHQLNVSRSTIERRITRAKAKLAKG